MPERDEQAVKERCDRISSNDRWIDVMVGHYYDQHKATPVNVIECNRIRQVVSDPEYIRTVAIGQLREEGVIRSEQ